MNSRPAYGPAGRRARKRGEVRIPHTAKRSNLLYTVRVLRGASRRMSHSTRRGVEGLPVLGDCVVQVSGPRLHEDFHIFQTLAEAECYRARIVRDDRVLSAFVYASADPRHVIPGWHLELAARTRASLVESWDAPRAEEPDAEDVDLEHAGRAPPLAFLARRVLAAVPASSDEASSHPFTHNQGGSRCT